MGAGEYVSVSSQADTERADLELERRAPGRDNAAEHEELRDIYILRGLDHDLATEVAQQLMAFDALGAHARDDIVITEALQARPLQAAVTSSISFVLGGMKPMIAGLLLPPLVIIPFVADISLSCLAEPGSPAAYIGGAPALRRAARVVIWGAIAMGVTGAMGSIFSAAI